MLKIAIPPFNLFSANDFNSLAESIFDGPNSRSNVYFALQSKHGNYIQFMSLIEKYISIGRETAIAGNKLKAYRIYIRIIVIYNRFNKSKRLGI